MQCMYTQLIYFNFSLQPFLVYLWVIHLRIFFFVFSFLCLVLMQLVWSIYLTSVMVIFSELLAMLLDFNIEQSHLSADTNECIFPLYVPSIFALSGVRQYIDLLLHTWSEPVSQSGS